MANTSLRIGGDNWAVKEDNLLGYNVIQNKYVPIEMDVVRATTATRVNEQGLIEVVPRNLASYSEQFDNAYWIKTRSTIIANATTSPKADVTADKLVETSVAGSHFVDKTFTTVASTIYTYSVFVKKAEREWFVIECLTTGKAIFVNLNDGSLGTRIGYLVSDINVETISNGWFRISVKDTSPSTVLRYLKTIAISSSSASYTGDGTSGVFIWGAQLEQGTLTDYFPTTDRLNIPRIDYSSGTASLLVEPQRTNLLTYSEQFDNASWSKLGVTITSNFSISPNGSQNSSLITDTTSFNSLQKTISISNATNYVYSFFVKNSSSGFITLRCASGTNDIRKIIEISTNTISDGGGNGIGFISAKSELINNDWYRVELVFLSGGTSLTANFYPDNISSTTQSSCEIYGAQLEAGSNATSYIPTVASAVTRTADVISKTGISNLIGQTEGTLFVDINSFQTNANRYISISDGTSNNYVYLRYIDSSNQIWFRIASNGIVGSVQTYTYTNPQDFIKTTIRYNNNSFDVFLNGVKIITSVGVNTLSGSMNQLKFSFPDNSNIFQGNAKTLALYKTALTDQECINLTTL